MPRFDENFQGPLAGKTVLDLSRLVAGNMVSLQLADYGAEVIKIEPAGKGDPLLYEALARLTPEDQAKVEAAGGSVEL